MYLVSHERAGLAHSPTRLGGRETGQAGPNKDESGRPLFKRDRNHIDKHVSRGTGIVTGAVQCPGMYLYLPVCHSGSFIPVRGGRDPLLGLDPGSWPPATRAGHHLGQGRNPYAVLHEDTAQLDPPLVQASCADPHSSPFCGTSASANCACAMLTPLLPFPATVMIAGECARIATRRGHAGDPDRTFHGW
jgi:hypothetical protein